MCVWIRCLESEENENEWAGCSFRIGSSRSSPAVLFFCFSINFTTGHLCTKPLWMLFYLNFVYVVGVIIHFFFFFKRSRGYISSSRLGHDRSCIKCWLTKKRGRDVFTLITHNDDEIPPVKQEGYGAVCLPSSFFRISKSFKLNKKSKTKPYNGGNGGSQSFLQDYFIACVFFFT